MVRCVEVHIEHFLFQLLGIIDPIVFHSQQIQIDRMEWYNLFEYTFVCDMTDIPDPMIRNALIH